MSESVEFRLFRAPYLEELLRFCNGIVTALSSLLVALSRLVNVVVFVLVVIKVCLRCGHRQNSPS